MRATLPGMHPFTAMDMPIFLRRTCAENADRLFLVWEPFDGRPARWTYAEGLTAIEAIAADYRMKGVAAGERVLIHLDNSPESVFAWLACSLLGAVAVTTNARCSGEELAFFAERSEAVGIFTQSGFAALAKAHLPEIGWTIVRDPGETILVSREGVSTDPTHADPAAPFSVQFTSGTTARPKGVVWSHANALWGAMVNARHLGLEKSDVALIFNPMFHTVGQAWQLLGSMWVGAAVVIQPKFSVQRFWDVVQRNNCTWCMGGIFTETALDGVPVPERHSLRFITGEVNKSAERQKWGVRALGGHGMTELITQCIYCDRHGSVDDQSLGRPAPEYEVSLRAPDDSFVPFGETGELCVRGTPGLSMFVGYLGDEEATRQSFTQDGYFRTGDLVRARADGALQFVDRSKDMLKVGGENVAASEVEAVIAATPGVREVAVVAKPHPLLVEVPFAFVVADQPVAPPDPEDILARCRDALADFKVPKGVRFVTELPRSMGGVKIRKADLRALLANEEAS